MQNNEKKKDEHKNEIFWPTGFLKLFCGKLQFFNPLRSKAIFCNVSSSCKRHSQLWPAPCAALHCSSSSFQLAVLCDFCCGQWRDLLGIIRSVVSVSAWRKECGSSEELLLRTGRKGTRPTEGKWGGLAGCSPGFGESEGGVSVTFWFTTCMAVSSVERRGDKEEPQPKEHGDIPFLAILWKGTVVLGTRCHFLCVMV